MYTHTRTHARTHARTQLIKNVYDDKKVLISMDLVEKAACPSFKRTI